MFRHGYEINYSKDLIHIFMKLCRETIFIGRLRQRSSYQKDFIFIYVPTLSTTLNNIFISEKKDMEDRSHVSPEISWINCRVGDGTEELVVVQVFQDDETRFPRCPGFPV